MNVQDKQTRNALGTLVTKLEDDELEIANLNQKIVNLENELENKDIEIDGLLNSIEELTAEVKRLDDALADTYVSTVDPSAQTRST